MLDMIQDMKKFFARRKIDISPVNKVDNIFFSFAMYFFVEFKLEFEILNSTKYLNCQK